MAEKLVLGRMHRISLDFKALNRYSINSNRKAISKAQKAGKSRPKCLSSDFSKESLGDLSITDGSVVSEVSLHATETENFNLQAKSCKILKSNHEVAKQKFYQN